MGIKSNPILSVLLRPVIWTAAFVGRHWPETLVKIRYFVRFKKRLNLNHPQTLNEKILYLSLRTDTTEWTRLADKYRVREYIKECGLDEILVPLHGYWHSADEIDFEALPQSFVLKTVQGSGDIILVKDKSRIDKNAVRRKMQRAVTTNYGELEGGKHYMRIEPAIIAEGMLTNDAVSQRYSSSLIDYKIWCFNGRAHYIMTCANREAKHFDMLTYDRDWSVHPEYSIFNDCYWCGATLPMPENYEEMIAIAEKLAKPFPVVRVDVYNVGGKIYFGEMTFTSLGGLMDYYTEEFQQLAGDLIDLNYKG